MLDKERSVLLVRGHQPTRQPWGRVDTSSMTAVGIVLSTHRSSSPDLVVDHPLWFACMEAVSTVVGATDSEVWLERRGFFRWLRRTKKSSGSLDGYIKQLRADRDADWDTIVWRKSSDLAAAATCERWHQAGGPAPYHDSYTTSLFLSRPAAMRLGAVLKISVGRAGGSYQGVVDARGTA